MPLIKDKNFDRYVSTTIGKDTLKYVIQGQDLVNVETGKMYPLTNGEFHQVTMMLSSYYLLLSTTLMSDDYHDVTNGYNRYLETFTN